MVEQTNCPACGAPLEFSGDTEAVRCGFCGAQVHVTKEGDQFHFMVTSQGSAASQPVADQNYGMAGPQMPEPPEAGGAAVYGNDPISLPPPVGAPIPPAPYGVDSGAPASPSSRPFNRSWIWIVVAALAGLCLVCSCSSLAIVIINRAR